MISVEITKNALLKKQKSKSRTPIFFFRTLFLDKYFQSMDNPKPILCASKVFCVMDKLDVLAFLDNNLG